MNTKRFLVALGVILCLVLSPVIVLMPGDTAQAQPADSPWPMFGQNPQRTGRSPYSGSEVPKQKWSFTTGDLVRSSPAIGADGTIYVGSNDDNLYAINPDGSLKWSFTTGDMIWSSPAIGADGTIYFGSGDNNLYAINPDGSLKWSFTTGSYVDSCPAIGADGTIYVGSYDDNLYAINPDGSLKWSFTTGDFIASSPAIGAEGTIYVGSSDNNLYAINPDGSLKWSFTTGDWVGSPPAIGADGIIYFGSSDNNLYAINPDGSLKWSFTTGDSVWSSPAIGADGTIYVGSHDNNLYAINPDGSQKWSFHTGYDVPSSPAIGADGTIYVGSVDDNLYAINPNGSLKWSFTTGDSVRSSPAIGADGTIYVGSVDDNLYAIAESGSWPTFFDATVPMRDGIQLYTRVYLPDSDIWGPGPYPVILERTPYGIGTPDSDPRWPLDIEFGYAHVDQDTRGRHSSQGLDCVFHDEISDGYDTLDWIAAQDWCDGNIGVFGYSASGINAFMAAGEAHPNLKAIAPLSSSGNLMNDLTFEGGAARGDALAWGVQQAASGLSTVTYGHRDLLGLSPSTFNAKTVSVKSLFQELITYVEWHNPTLPDWPATYKKATESAQWMHLPLYDFHDDVVTLQPYIQEISNHPSQDEWRDHYKVYDTVEVPTLLVTGWYDFFVRCQVDAFVALQERDIPVKLIVGPGTHVDPPFGWDGLDEYVKEWFDYWLKGVDNGIMDEQPIHYYCLEADEWRWADQWPPEEAKYVNYYLYEDGVLSTDLPSGREEPANYTYEPMNPVLTMSGENLFFVETIEAGPFDQTPVVLDRDDILSYTSSPLTEDVEIAGPLTVVLSVSSDCTDTDFTAKLIDVHPTGELMLVADGIIRARYRDSMATPELMEPDTVYTITFDIGHISHLFETEHSIRVDISSSNFPKYDRNLNTGGALYKETEWVVAENTIYHDADNPSYIMLPVIKDWEEGVCGCFIATAAYGTPMAEEIEILREFRDEYLLTNPVGKALVEFYYRVSPPIAEFINEHPSLKPVVRAGLLPAVVMSAVAVNTSPAEKTAMVVLLVLVSVALAVWAARGRGRSPEYNQG